MKKELATKKIDLENTKPLKKYFNGFIDFINTNYRGTIEETKVEEIVKSIKKEKFSYIFPYIVNAKTFSVIDGLARISALKKIKNQEPKIYEKIKKNEVQIIFLAELDFSSEAKEYQNINRGNKNKNLIPAKLVQKFANRNKSSSDKEKGLRLTKIEFLCYELAKVLNAEHNYWRYKFDLKKEQEKLFTL